MTVEEVMQFRRAEPFQPFVLRLKDGREFVVPDPMNIGRNDSGTRITVALPNEDAFETFEGAAADSVKPLNGRPSSRGKGRRRR